MTKNEVKKCAVCHRPMSDDECGDEFPEERVCDQCAGIAPQLEAALNKAHAALFDAQRLLGWSSKSALEVGGLRNEVYKLRQATVRAIYGEV